MRSIKDRALMIMRSLSAKTHMFTISVVACTLFLSALFFLEPNTDFSRATMQVTKEMETVSSSDLQILVEVKTLSMNSEEGMDEVVVQSLTKDEDTTESIDEKVASISIEEYDELCRLVQAEANSEDITGRCMVADVVLNRVKSSKYENDIISVINEPGQFDPACTKAIKYIVPNHDTKVAVMKALSEEDLTGGAIYFQKSSSTEWGDRTYLFRYGSHSFYK